MLLRFSATWEEIALELGRWGDEIAELGMVVWTAGKGKKR